MELDLDKIEQTQQTFNEKYGVNFRIFEFNGQMRALDDNFVGRQEDYDIHYKMNFMKLLRRAFDNFVDNRLNIDEFDPKEMLNDFEEMVMKPYREECKSKNAISPFTVRMFGTWSRTSIRVICMCSAPMSRITI